MLYTDYQALQLGQDPANAGMNQIAAFEDEEDDIRLRPGYSPETSFMGDIVRGLGYGVQQAVGGVYELADTLLADSLTDWENTQASKLIEAPTTWAGGLASVGTQFIVPFFALGPVAGLGGRALAASKLAGSTVPVASGAARGAAKGLQWLSYTDEAANSIKFLQKADNAIKAGNTGAAAAYTVLHGSARGAVKGAIVDFTVTTKGEETLSTFLQGFPELQNPLFEALAVDEDDGVFMSKTKAVIEGAGLGFALDSIIIGLKARKAYQRARKARATHEEASIQATKAASDSATVIKEQKRELEEIELRTIGARPVSVIDPDAPAPALREGTPAPGSIAEDTDGILSDPGTSPGLPHSAPQTIKGLIDENFREQELWVEVLDSLGIAGRADAENYLTEVADLADDVGRARFTEEMFPRDPKDLFEQNPRKMDRGTLEDNGMTELSRNLRNLAGTEDGFKYLVRFLEDVKAPEGITSESMVDALARQMAKAKKVGSMSMADVRASIDQQLKDNVDFRDIAFRTAVKNLISIKYGEVVAPYVGALAQRPELDLASVQAVGNMFKGWADLQNSVRGFHSEMGRQLKQLHQKINVNAVVEEMNTKFTFEPLELIQSITEETFDADVARKLLVEMSQVMQSPDPLSNMLAAQEFLMQPRHKKALALMQEFHINALLSGVATQVVNTVSGAFVSFWRPAEQLVGGALMRIQGELTSNQDMIAMSKHIIGEEKLTALNLYSDFMETFQAVRQSGGSFAAAASKQEGERFSPLKATAQRMDRNRQGNLFTILARGITTPASVLDKTDVFFKEWNGRAKARAVITRGLKNSGVAVEEIPERTEMLLKGITEHKGHLRSRATLVKDIRNATHPALAPGDLASKSNVLRDASNVEIDIMIEAQEKAILRGMEATFQTEIKPITSADRIALNVQRTVQDAPILKFFLPFVRTPYNIATYGWDRSVGAVFGGAVESARSVGQKFGMELPRTEASIGKISRMLATGRPEELAQVRANLALGIGGVASMVHLASESFTDENGFTLPTVTGSGPSDPDALKVMKAAGWQPYSWRIGDKYYSYQRLDPIATLLGIVVDVGEYYNEASDVEKGEVFTTATTAIATSLMGNVLNKTYMTGLQNIIDAMTDEDRARTVLGATAGSFVPAIVANANKIIDSDLREIRSFVDRVRSRIPGMSQELPTKRDLLGQPIRQEAPVWEFFAPVRVTAIKDDKVREELAKFAYGFSQPATSRLGVDLLDPKFANNGQLTYDRHLELSGKVRIRGLDLRQALRKEISDPNYQKLDPLPGEAGENSPRIDRIQSILRRYRAAAWEETLRENSTLRSGVDEATRIRSRRRRGLSL